MSCDSFLTAIYWYPLELLLLGGEVYNVNSWKRIQIGVFIIQKNSSKGRGSFHLWRRHFILYCFMELFLWYTNQEKRLKYFNRFSWFVYHKNNSIKQYKIKCLRHKWKDPRPLDEFFCIINTPIWIRFQLLTLYTSPPRSSNSKGYQ